MLLRREVWREGGRRLTHSDRRAKGWGRKVCKQGFVIQEVELLFSKICHWSSRTVGQTRKYAAIIALKSVQHVSLDMGPKNVERSQPKGCND